MTIQTIPPKNGVKKQFVAKIKLHKIFYDSFWNCLLFCKSGIDYTKFLNHVAVAQPIWAIKSSWLVFMSSNNNILNPLQEPRKKTNKNVGFCAWIKYTHQSF
jgi:hypothetical protein